MKQTIECTYHGQFDNDENIQKEIKEVEGGE